MMSREERRKRDKIEKKKYKKFTIVDVQKAMSIALEMKKESKGHLFQKQMKELCVFCGASRKSKNQCEFWFMTFLDRMQTILVNPDFFKGLDQEAIWLQHGDEYQDLRVLSKETINGK